MHLGAERFAKALRERDPPRRVDASTERRVQHDTHTPRLVAKILGDERAIVGNDARRHTLFLRVFNERPRGVYESDEDTARSPVATRCSCAYSTSDRAVSSSLS